MGTQDRGEHNPIGAPVAGSADDDPRWRQPEFSLGHFDPPSRMGPPPRSFAHRCACCIMVQIHSRSTEYKSAARTSAPGSRRARLGIDRWLFSAGPDPGMPTAVLVTVKDKSLRDEGPCSPPILDRHCARRVSSKPGRDEEMVTNWPNKEMRKRTKIQLDNHRPIQVKTTPTLPLILSLKLSRPQFSPSSRCSRQNQIVCFPRGKPQPPHFVHPGCSQ